MALSRPIDEQTTVAISLDTRRAQLKRRRRMTALREWAGLAAVTAVGLWLAVLALFTLLGH